MESEHMDEMRKVRDEVADILAAALLEMILAGNGPGTESQVERPAIRVEDEGRPSCH